jgi:ferric-dicitrate binding protein FerR (iron transport regulator)
MKDSLEVRIGRYLAGEMSEQERAGFQQELASDPAMERAFLGYQRMWQAKPVEPKDQWDTDLAWINFEKDNTVIIAPFKKSRSNVLYWSIAASLVLVIGATFYFLSRSSSKTYLYTDAASSIIELKDGSKVHLNKTSAVTVFPFTKKGRQVELTGEAFFEVSPDVKRPFTITCGNTETTVVGTSFDIKQWKDEVHVYVQTGKVIFRSTEDREHALALQAGEAAYFENSNMRMVPNPSPNSNAWHTKELRLYKLSMEQAIADVSDYFGKVIDIENPDIKACGVSITLPFKNPEIENVLKAISKSINAQLVQEKDQYIIRGGSCN